MTNIAFFTTPTRERGLRPSNEVLEVKGRNSLVMPGEFIADGISRLKLSGHPDGTTIYFSTNETVEIHLPELIYCTPYGQCTDAHRKSTFTTGSVADAIEKGRIYYRDHYKK